MYEKPVKSGMVALVGPPNAGKSTLMNHLLGQKISIVTPKPQTTRNRILGVVNGQNFQIVLLDTPGLHQSRIPLNKEMVKIAMDTLADVDLVLFLMDVSLPVVEKQRKEKERELSELMQQVRCPAILVLNKVDLLAKERLLPMIEAYAAMHPFAAILPLSALRGEGTDRLVAEVLALLPTGPRYFPEDMPTDSSERFLVGEIIREKVFLQTGQEIPYSCAVVIDSFKEQKERPLTEIYATIVVERDSQKGIVIGKGGSRLKAIGTAARKDIERLLAQSVFLKLWVKVKKKWSEDERFLRELGL
ncbi:MAG: GTPase Era [Desulfopila sp.]